MRAGGIAQFYGFMIQNSLNVASRAKKKERKIVFLVTSLLALLNWDASYISLRALLKNRPASQDNQFALCKYRFAFFY